MKMKWMAVLLIVHSTALAQTVFTNGIDVNKHYVRGVGLLDMTNTNLPWGSMTPSLAQLVGVDPINGTNLASTFFLPLRPAWLETDGVYARTSNGLTFYDENGTAVLRIRAGVLWGVSNLTVNAATISGGRLGAALLPRGGMWDTGGMTLSNVTISGNGTGLRGVMAQHVVGLGSAAMKNMTDFAMAEQGNLADTALQPDSYAPDLGACITTSLTAIVTVLVTGGNAGTYVYTADDGSYFYASSLDAVLDAGSWSQGNSQAGDLWRRISNSWYLAATTAAGLQTGTLTAVNVVYLWGSDNSDVNGTYAWNSESNRWEKAETAYYIANNNGTYDLRDDGSLLATNSTLNGGFVSATPTLDYYGIWGNPMSGDWDGDNNCWHWQYDEHDQMILTPSDGKIYYIQDRGGGPYYTNLIAECSPSPAGTVSYRNVIFISGANLEANLPTTYLWDANSSRWVAENSSGFYITTTENVYTVYDSSDTALYSNSYSDGLCDSINGAGYAYMYFFIGRNNTMTSLNNYYVSSYYPDQSPGLSQFGTTNLNSYFTNTLSAIGGMALTALQPGASLSNMVGQLAVTALPSGAGQAWNAGGLSINNVTISGNGAGLSNVPSRAIVGLSADQITAGLLNTSVLSTNGVWNLGGLVLTNVGFAAGAITTPTLAQVLAAGNDGGGQIITNAVLRYIPPQGDLSMGPFTSTGN